MSVWKKIKTQAYITLYSNNSLQTVFWVQLFSSQGQMLQALMWEFGGFLGFFEGADTKPFVYRVHGPG